MEKSGNNGPVRGAIHGNSDPRRAGGTAVWDDAHRRLTIGLLLTISITAFEALAVATVLPETVTDLGGTAAIGWYGWVFSGFMLANLVGIPAAGILADRGGPARPFVVGCLLFSLGLVVAGLAWSMPMVVIGRVAQGFGAGALSSVAYVAIARGYEAVDQPRMLALLASAWVIPGLLGPVAAAALSHAFGWRSVFLLLVPMTGAAAVLAVKGLGQLAPSRGNDGPSQMGTALQLALGAGLALLGAETHSLPTMLASAVVGGAIGIPALLRLLPPGTLTAREGAPAALAAKGLITFAFFGAEAFLPLSLTVVRGESIAMAGAALTAGTLAWTTGAWIQERLITTDNRLTLIRVGLVMVGLGVLGAASVLVVANPVPVAIGSWTLAGLGIGVAYSTTTLIVFDRTPDGDEGSAASALQLVNVLGIAFGTGVAGALLSVATSSGWSQSVGIGAADTLMIVAALAGVVAVRSRARTDPAR